MPAGYGVGDCRLFVVDILTSSLVTKERDRTCPRTRFKSNLITQLMGWRKEGDRLIVCMDINEDIYRKSIGKSLTESEDLLMVETVGNYTGLKIGAVSYSFYH